MSVKIIAVDMDGTFLTRDNKYNTEKFMKQYQQMKERGIHFVVASGNQYYQLRSFFPEIQKEITFIAENGAYIVDQGKDQFVAELSKEDLQTVLRAIHKYPDVVKVICGRDSAYVHERIDDTFYKDLNFYYHRLQKVENFNDFDDTIFKIFLSCDKDNFDTILQELKEEIGHIMTPVDCGHFGIDLIIPGINKSHGIAYLKKLWNMEEAEVMAFGDSGNDYEMLEMADYSFAMKNAKDSIKGVAKYTITSNDEGGVLSAIQWMLDKQEMFSK